MDISKFFTAVLRQARLTRGETQATVASRLRHSQQIVSRIERGQAGFDLLAAGCRAIGLELRVQVGDDVRTIVHPIDPDERREIEANLDWFGRLEPARRLATIARQTRSLVRLREEVQGGR